MRGRLVFTSGSRAGTDFELTGFEVTVGRSPDCALQFSPSEVVVSGHHATLYEVGGRYYVRDENSRNGTFVDGRQVKECEIRSGQTVMFGPNGPSAQLEVVAEEGMATSPMPAAWGSPATAYVPPKAAKAPALPPAGGGGSSGSGLTSLYFMARDQAAAAAASGRPSQTAVMKAFVKLAQEKTSRRFKVLLTMIAAVGAVAVGLVFVLGERKAGSLRGQLTAMGSELQAQGGAREALEQKLAQLASSATQWQSQAESLSQNLQENRAEIESQRREVAQQRQAVEDDRRFGPTVTQKFAAGVGLIEFGVGLYNDKSGWLRLHGNPDSNVSFTVRESDKLAVVMTSNCTGFLIDPAGWVLTNRHCVDPAFPSTALMDEWTVKIGDAEFKPAIAWWRIAFPPGTVYDVDPRTVRASSVHDLGLFRTARSPSGVPMLPLARGQVVTGEEVVLLAYPGGTIVTAQRRGLGSFVDPSFREQLGASVSKAMAAFLQESGLGPFWSGLPLDDEKKLQALMQANKGVELVVNTVMAIQGVALFNALSEAGQVQPDVSGRMGVAGVTANSISYHSLSAIGGASGGPLVSTKLAVVGINHAGFGEQDRGSQFQQAEAVPIDFAWRFLPAGLGHAK